MGAEESVEEGCAFGFEDATADLWAVIETAVTDYVPKGADGTGFRFPGAEDQATDPSEHQGARAHGARLQGYRECAVFQPPTVAEDRGRAAQGEDLGVRGRVAEGLPGIGRAREFTPVGIEDDGTDRHVAIARIGCGGDRGPDHIGVVGEQAHVSGAACPAPP